MQNKITVIDKNLLNHTVNELIDNKVYATYLFVANKVDGPQKSNKYFIILIL